MRRLALILSLLAVGAAAARPLNAQKVRPTPTGPDADGDEEAVRAVAAAFGWPIFVVRATKLAAAKKHRK